MHLEKATSRSGHDALAGWISSNDVTLFTTVLVLAIALFLHASLNRRAKEKVQLSEANVALSERLTATASDRDASLKLLDETRESLNLTQEERDQLQQAAGREAGRYRPAECEAGRAARGEGRPGISAPIIDGHARGTVEREDAANCAADPRSPPTAIR